MKYDREDKDLCDLLEGRGLHPIEFTVNAFPATGTARTCLLIYGT